MGRINYVTDFSVPYFLLYLPTSEFIFVQLLKIVILVKDIWIIYHQVPRQNFLSLGCAARCAMIVHCAKNKHK